MTTISVIPNFNVLEDSTACGRSGQPFSAFDQLPAQRGKETFGHCIVIAVGAPTHTGSDVIGRQQLAVIGGGILHAAIAVMEQAGLRLPASQGHAQSVQAQFGFQGLIHGPTHYHTASEIQQHRQVQPPLAGANIGNVSTPDAIRTTNFGHAEASLQYFVRYSITMFRIGGLLTPAPPRAGAQPRCTHQASDALSTAAPATGAYLAMDAWCAVGFSTALINGANNGAQDLIFPCSRTAGSPFRRIEAGATNLQCSTHREHRKLLPVQADAGVLHGFSFAKYAAAFFRKSRSSVTRANSCRKRRSSCSRLVTRPCPRNTSFKEPSLPSTCRFQARNISGRIPNWAATRETDCPLFTKRTASNLNSRVNCLRFCDINTSHPKSINRVFQGVHKIEASPLCALCLCGVFLLGIHQPQRHREHRGCTENGVILTFCAKPFDRSRGFRRRATRNGRNLWRTSQGSTRSAK